jgi:hypothetical protein
VSHCPGPRLEDWITDYWHIVDADGEYGTGIRRWYTGQLIFSKEQFAALVAIYEPAREHVERLIGEFDEEEQSWRAYCDVFAIPQDIKDKARQYVESLRDKVPKTPGLGI